MRWTLTFCLLIRVWGVDFHDFDGYQNCFTREEVEKKITAYLQKDIEIGKFYRLSNDALEVGDLPNHQIDYTLHFASSFKQTPNKNKHRLEGAKIAIDPGHFGGLFAKLEERCVFVPAQETKSDRDLSFDEGTLTYLTAIHLKTLLEEAGAKTFITRSGIGTGAIKEPFFEWLQKQPALWESLEPLSKLFRNYYNRLDLFCRASEINRFNPDITVIIHYNAYLSEEEKNHGASLTQANYNLAFIPGAYCATELGDIEDRYEFLRLIVTDHLEQSLKLSHHLVKEFTAQLRVPLMEKTTYLEKSCLKHQAGIYSRNLALTRRIHSPLCYGETLIQNNKEEFLRLSTHDTEIAGIPCSGRIREVAQAYFDGIQAYFEDFSTTESEKGHRERN